MNRSGQNNATWAWVGALAVVAAAIGGACWLLLLRTSSLPQDGQRNPAGSEPRPPAPAVAAHETPPSAKPGGASSIRLHDATDATGITFVHTDGASGKCYIMEMMSAGLALFDYDNDGLIDIYFPNGAPLRGGQAAAAPVHALYKNLGGWRFADVTEKAGVACAAFGLGIAVGDYDNDGCPDIYLSNFGPKTLYRSHGDGTFADVTQSAGVANGNRMGAGVLFLDADKDGLLDLFAANYVKFDYGTHRALRVGNRLLYPSPLDYATETDALFRNCGDGAFADVSLDSDVGRRPGNGMGATAADYDNDGDVDLLVGNDQTANFLFQNDGRGTFREIGLYSGFAYDGAGRPKGTMGVDCGDYDNDGRLDVYATAYQNESATLYRNLRGDTFFDVTRLTGAAQGTLSHVMWGCAWVDLDNDGDRDLFVACGHFNELTETGEENPVYRAPSLVFKNLLVETGQARFVNVSDQCGDGPLLKAASRGAAFDDLDNDGDVDVVFQNSRARPAVLRNMLIETGSKSHWLEIRLCGVKTNRDGVNARVRVVAGNLTQIDEVHSGRGYQSHFGTRLHFGLGTQGRVDRVEVRWIGGGLDILENPPADRLLTITESRQQNP